MSSSAQIANFASGLGIYDTTLVGSSISLDVSGNIGSSDLSMNAGYLLNTTALIMPPAVTGNGISMTGWFNPNGNQGTSAAPIPIVDISINAAYPISICVSGNYLGVFASGSMVPTLALPFTSNAWNLFQYTMCCSGTALVQSLYVNSGSVVYTSGTYVPYTISSTYVGYGTGILANYFNGKVDDFRYYSRVLTPMEFRVLYGYAYRKTGLTSVTPSIGGTITAQVPVGLTFTFNLPGAGTYGFLQATATQAGQTYTKIVSTSALVQSGTNYTWTDTAAAGGGWVYTFTPYIMGTYGATQTLAVTTAFLTVNPAITNFASTDASGLAVSNGITYQVYAFKTASLQYTVKYSCYMSTLMYVLAVGGGGGGASNAGSGGGGGGVVMQSVTLPVGANQSINVYVGAGGAGAASNPNSGSQGTTTTVQFTVNSALNINAWGGGAGSQWNVGTGNSGGSAGGVGNISWGFVTPNNTYNNFGNGAILYAGGTGGVFSSGGGGAGTAPATGNGYVNNLATVRVIAQGGAGIQCPLPGISMFAPSGVAYGTYYWAGGGGGSSGNGCVGAGNGGIGGGGGASTQSGPATVGLGGGLGGGSALNAGANGGVSDGASPYGPAGAAGANTGGGGGGSWNGIGGAGGSGIVVLAFPQTLLTNNMVAALPAAQLASGAYNDVLSRVSTQAYNAFKGAYSCRLVNYNYFGPVMTLRHTADLYGNYTQNFYADVCGNLGTGYLGTGIPVSAWLAATASAAAMGTPTTSGIPAATTYAYVTKWYDQAMDICFNCAYQYTLNSQPIYDLCFGVVNFGYAFNGASAPPSWTNASYGVVYGNYNITGGFGRSIFFNLPNGALPYCPTANYDTSYSVVTKLLNTYPGGFDYGMVLFGGYVTSNQGLGVGLLNTGTVTAYRQEWWVTGYLAVGGIVSTPNMAFSVTYAATNMASVAGTVNMYLTPPGTAMANVYTYTPPAVRAQISTANTIGINSFANAPLNSQMHFLYVSNVALTAADRVALETTPTGMANTTFALTYVAGTATTSAVTVSWTTPVGVTSYAYYINGVSATPTTPPGASGAVTAVFTGLASGPASVIVMGYNATGTLVTTGTTSVPYLTVNPAITNFLATDVSGTSISNGITYQVYVCKRTDASYNFTYTMLQPSYVYVLAVGGGGAGGSFCGGGGGAGGVVMNPVLLPAGNNQTINLTVGLGGLAVTNTTGKNGTNTVVLFGASSASNLVALGGGGGGGGSAIGTPGASGGGSANNYSSAGGGSVTNNNNYGNQGAAGGAGGAISMAGGGGGGGTAGIVPITSLLIPHGGMGIQCFLPGIASFAPAGVIY